MLMWSDRHETLAILINDKVNYESKLILKVNLYTSKVQQIFDPLKVKFRFKFFLFIQEVKSRYKYLANILTF